MYTGVKTRNPKDDIPQKKRLPRNMAMFGDLAVKASDDSFECLDRRGLDTHFLEAQRGRERDGGVGVYLCARMEKGPKRPPSTGRLRHRRVVRRSEQNPHILGGFLQARDKKAKWGVIVEGGLVSLRTD